MKTVRVILNGKGAANPQVREAVNKIRNEGQPLEVRCTWEGGDAARFAQRQWQTGSTSWWRVGETGPFTRWSTG